jgi:hypothetical protein
MTLHNGIWRCAGAAARHGVEMPDGDSPVSEISLSCWTRLIERVSKMIGGKKTDEHDFHDCRWLPRVWTSDQQTSGRHVCWALQGMILQRMRRF